MLKPNTYVRICSISLTKNSKHGFSGQLHDGLLLTSQTFCSLMPHNRGSEGSSKQTYSHCEIQIFHIDYCQNNKLKALLWMEFFYLLKNHIISKSNVKGDTITIK